MTGDVHGTNPSSSSEQANAAAWLEEKVKVAVVSLVVTGDAGGPERIVVSGGARTVHEWLAGDRSTLPAESLALTMSWCGPSARLLNTCGDGQDENGAPSSEHSKFAPTSFEAKVKLAVVPRDSAAGPEAMVVSGA